MVLWGKVLLIYSCHVLISVVLAGDQSNGGTLGVELWGLKTCSSVNMIFLHNISKSFGVYSNSRCQKGVRKGWKS